MVAEGEVTLVQKGAPHREKGSSADSRFIKVALLQLAKSEEGQKMVRADLQ